MKRIDNLFLLLAVIGLLASSCGEDDGVKLQGAICPHGVVDHSSSLLHTSSAGEKISAVPYRSRLDHFISSCFTADNTNSATSSTLLAVELTKHVDLSN